ncbi:uncharacterized protein VP01_5338g1, partial [Puccinia sorghi]
MKTEAEEIYHEYQKKIMLVAFKHWRPAVALSNYLGQGRTHESNAWDNYRALSSDVKNILKGGQKEVGQQNKEIAKAWRCLDSKTQEGFKDKAYINSLKDQSKTDLPLRVAQTCPTKTLMANTKTWEDDVVTK